ncbi:Larval serum protein 2 [Pseudolycoriella hygida]|uniref:Larval serum protein 2 n=1 Tax=Pseudolycoriella hygida TaxID=35572 RepID=A0A9Q0MV69_9DIPT|nr:Larval serum protein 2 [Pseudolycoriella hygida]
MRSISLVILLGIAAFSCGFSALPKPAKVADKDFLFRQKSILELLQHIGQNNVLPHIYQEFKDYRIEDHYDYYTNVEAVQEFVKLYRFGLLPVNEIFSINNEYHREQAVALFHVFYYAKDWKAFYASAAWARFHVNEGMFVYALTVSILHRKDPATLGLVLPAPYEIYPYYFFHSATIQQAYSYKMEGFRNVKKIDGVYNVYIPSNYTNHNVKYNEEHLVSYYTEDIGLNSYYYYFHTDYPFWMGGLEYNLYKDRRGEYYLYEHQQNLARYYLERLSNGLGDIPEFSWYEPIKTGYYPSLYYYNGVFFPERNNYYSVYTEQNYYDVDVVTDYERRIRDAINYGFITLPEGKFVDLTKPESIEDLGNFIQGNPDSPYTRFNSYFAILAKTLLGGSFNYFYDYHVNAVPSVLEHFETSMRDPVFYQLYKRIVRFYWQFQDKLTPYTKPEIDFDGVKIESVEMDKLITYFDVFDADITNVVDVEPVVEKKTEFLKFGRVSHYEGEDIYLKARQYRLNHVPFTFELKVSSNRAVESVVRVFIGPKYDEYGHPINVNENRKNFVVLEAFRYDLVSGNNVIRRSSQDFSWFVKDRTTYYELYKSVMSAYKGQTTFTLDMSEAHSGFPNRLLLPKGSKGGYPFQFYFIITPYNAPEVEQYSTFEYTISTGVGSGSRYVDKLPFGYPFDRKIDSTIWYTPNMYYYDVHIFHKTEFDINAVPVKH